MHCIEGLIARYEHLKTAQESMVPEAHVAQLPQGFGLFILTDEPTNNYDDYPDSLPNSGEPVAEDFYFCRVSESLCSFASEVSRSCPVAYVATCYWGGNGVQSSGLWETGQQVETPLWSSGYPISAVLKRIGVDKQDAFDEFEAAHLGWYRNNRDWISFAQHGKAHWEADAATVE